MKQASHQNREEDNETNSSGMGKHGEVDHKDRHDNDKKNSKRMSTGARAPGLAK